VDDSRRSEVEAAGHFLVLTAHVFDRSGLLVKCVTAQTVGVGFSGVQSKSVRATSDSARRRHEWFHAATQGVVVEDPAAARPMHRQSRPRQLKSQCARLPAHDFDFTGAEGCSGEAWLECDIGLWSGCWVPVDVARFLTNTPTD
jgi:hypothetical protein